MPTVLRIAVASVKGNSVPSTRCSPVRSSSMNASYARNVEAIAAPSDSGGRDGFACDVCDSVAGESGEGDSCALANDAVRAVAAHQEGCAQGSGGLCADGVGARDCDVGIRAGVVRLRVIDPYVSLA
nr:hypothetical protein [Glaciibacter superstes]